MKYQKMISLLDKKHSQPSKLSLKNWVEKNADYRGTCDTSS